MKKGREGPSQASRVRMGENHVVSGQKLLGNKLRAFVLQESVLVVKVRREVFAHFQAVPVKQHSIMRNSLFNLRGKILCEQFL
jgi:hypothetical protein